MRLSRVLSTVALAATVLVAPATTLTAVKIRWGLSADSSEKAVLNDYASRCSNTVTVVRA